MSYIIDSKWECSNYKTFDMLCPTSILRIYVNGVLSSNKNFRLAPKTLLQILIMDVEGHIKSFKFVNFPFKQTSGWLKILLNKV